MHLKVTVLKNTYSQKLTPTMMPCGSIQDQVPNGSEGYSQYLLYLVLCLVKCAVILHLLSGSFSCVLKVSFISHSVSHLPLFLNRLCSNMSLCAPDSQFSRLFFEFFVAKL